ncbi:MAG: DUF1501 domain-containing protein [Verrucomicrobiales bacterium]|nr:DUF1501 domain-containing protein [Verrucomicrobiales bacterium]
MSPPSQLPFSRRRALKYASSGFGYLAFAALAHEQARAAGTSRIDPLAPKTPHFSARAKRVIFLSMRGAPSHVDTFDYKPQLTKDNGKAGQLGSTRGDMLMGSPWDFKQHGESGLWISSLFPGVAKHADDLCLLRSMQTDQPNHPQATLQMNTGSFQFVRPSLGAWSLYGLGTENSDLPGFITLNPRGSAQNYGSSFLPAIYQGSKLDSGAGRRGPNAGGGGAPKIPNIKNRDMNGEQQRVWLDYVQSLNQNDLSRRVHQPGIEGVIESFEMAFKMQDSLPEQIDLTGESQATLDLYGVGNATTDTFAKQCLLARRLSESGVRFIEVNHSSSWDHHQNLKNDMEKNCSEIDQPIAALLTDLKQRNLLDDTLVIWAGEFGRTPHSQGSDGRDHNNKGFTTWMAGGGVKGGFSYGSTDEHGYEAVENKMHIHDWHATILHLLGINHEKLTYNYAGRDFRLTDVHGYVAKDILA